MSLIFWVVFLGSFTFFSEAVLLGIGIDEPGKAQAASGSQPVRYVEMLIYREAVMLVGWRGVLLPSRGRLRQALRRRSP